MLKPYMKITISRAYLENFAAHAREEAERMAKEADIIIARAESKRRELEDEKARIRAASQLLAEGKGKVFTIDFKGRHFIG